MIRYGVIGAGMMGREHIANLKLIEGAAVVAVADTFGPSLEAAKQLVTAETDVVFLDSYQHMLDTIELDALIVATPNNTHLAVFQDIAERDIAVLMEKPLCSTVEDALRLEEMAKHARARICVGLEYRYMPPVARFIARAHEGETGPIRMLSIREHRFPFLPKVQNWNRFSSNTGGTLVEKCCHFFDLMRYILRDEPVRIYASGGQEVNHLEEIYEGKRPDVLDTAYVIVDFEGGARAALDLCMYAEGSEQQEHIYVLGERGKLEVTIPGADVTWSPRDKSGPVIEHVPTPATALAAGSHHGATYFQHMKFHKALLNDTPFEVGVRDGVRSVEMGAAAHQSITEGRPIDLTVR